MRDEKSQQEHDTLMRLLRKFIAAPALTGEAHSAPDNDPVASRTKRAGQTGRRQIISREDRP